MNHYRRKLALNYEMSVPDEIMSGTPLEFASAIYGEHTTLEDIDNVYLSDIVAKLSGEFYIRKVYGYIYKSKLCSFEEIIQEIYLAALVAIKEFDVKKDYDILLEKKPLNRIRNIMRVSLSHYNKRVDECSGENIDLMLSTEDEEVVCGEDITDNCLLFRTKLNSENQQILDSLISGDIRDFEIISSTSKDISRRRKYQIINKFKKDILPKVNVERYKEEVIWS